MGRVPPTTGRSCRVDVVLTHFLPLVPVPTSYVFNLADLLIVTEDEIWGGQEIGKRDCWHVTPLDRVLTAIEVDKVGVGD